MKMLLGAADIVICTAPAEFVLEMCYSLTSGCS
jgi:hypothetical protein